MSAINYQGEHIEDYVDRVYPVETYLKIYELSIVPINGHDEWSKTGVPKLEVSLPLGSTNWGRPHVTRHHDEDKPPPKTKKCKAVPPMKERTSQLRHQQRTI